ncbi:NERD domain-containing protein [Gudongella oleilytica]|uniref:NERD domain-containing protein n=1 Tax=Gudongella oleilytica TaxID=1582259 RepID=UPI000FF89917|nr:NERD domain-containing protein [Gudongella oleilytica]
MAIMYPESIETYNPTESERYIYNKLKSILPDSYRVFYSIKWYTLINNIRVDSESDFLVLDPTLGYICIEVKGGESILVEGDKWILKLNDNEERVLKRSPYKQAEESMRYFKNYYEEQFGHFYKGVFGYAVAFPYYNIDAELGPGCPKEITIQYSDMELLARRIKEIFNYWRGNNHNFIAFSSDQRKKLINAIHKRVSLSAAAGALMEYKRAQLELINRVQDNYLHFLMNHNQVYITGGAGTGKTWIGIKKAKNDAKLGKKVLFLCSSATLANSIRSEIIGFDSLKVYTIKDLVKETLSPEEYDQVIRFEDLRGVENFIESKQNIEKFDSIVIDEGQDFTAELAYMVRFFLKDQIASSLYVFYDSFQNIHKRDFANEFDIKTPPFQLIENLRNTSSIYKWAVNRTSLGDNVVPNTIEGADPESINLISIQSARNKLENILRTLIDKEGVNNKSITIISDCDYSLSILGASENLGKWEFVTTLEPTKDSDIRFRTIEQFKGLESDVIIFLNHNDISKELYYVAYTRARFYLYEIKIK